VNGACPPQMAAWRRLTPGYLLAVLGGFLVCCWLDTWAYHALRLPREALNEDWYRLLRVLGYGPTWLVVAAAFWLHDARRWSEWCPTWSRLRRQLAAATDRALMVILSVALAGGLAELLKLVARRERPDAHAGEYVFRPWFERTLDGGGLGLPSGHTAVAFAAAFALCRLLPDGRWLWLALAAGCGLTRMFAGAHFLSDVFLAAVVSHAVVAALARQRRRIRTPGLGPDALTPLPYGPAHGPRDRRRLHV